ncbi:MAG: A/G-specific adenine glycosylase, partial [Gemmatimonadota bacterium]
MKSRPDEMRADLNAADPSPSPDPDEVVPNSAAGIPPGVAEVVNRAAALAPEIRHILLRAYDEGKRDLPWRRETDPYRVWVSEVMLQQTRVETVIPYYRTWVTRFPDLESLAAAEEEDVLRAWKGLGYYSRARNLQRAARVVRERFNGKLPADGNDLRSLPGIGEYTAGALASIAFGRPVPAVDGNVRRVLARLFDLPDPGAAELRALASELVDPRR